MGRLASIVVAVGVAACANRAKQSIVLYDAGDYKNAGRVADEGLAQHPDDNDLWAMRVRAALALGDADAVATAYEGYVARRGGDDKELDRDLAIATLGQALASPSARLKIAAIDAVAELELHALADQVAERLGDDDDRVAASAAAAVLRGFPGAPQVADAMLRSENAEARRIAVDGVGKKVGQLAAADLEKAASDPDARVRRAALHWLGAFQDANAVTLCTQRMHDRDAGVRAAAASALAQIGLGNLESLGKQALRDPALEVRLAGVELLVAAHRDDELAALIDDPEPLVALQAAIAIHQPALATKAIARAATADAWTTRAGAANLAVAAVGRDAARALALTLANDKHTGVRLAAARVLAHAGDVADAKRIFADALASKDYDVEAATDLAALGDATAAHALSSFVRDAKRTPEQRAAAAAAHRTARRITPGLVAALADRNAIVRVAAAAALAALSK